MVVIHKLRSVSARKDDYIPEKFSETRPSYKLKTEAPTIYLDGNLAQEVGRFYSPTISSLHLDEELKSDAMSAMNFKYYSPMGSNPIGLAVINHLLSRMNIEYRIAAQKHTMRHLLKSPNGLEDHCVETGLLVTDNNQHNSKLSKHLIPQLKRLGVKFPMLVPYASLRIDGRDLVVDEEELDRRTNYSTLVGSGEKQFSSGRVSHRTGIPNLTFAEPMSQRAGLTSGMCLNRVDSGVARLFVSESGIHFETTSVSPPNARVLLAKPDQL